jgi:UDP-glucose 4-epimerase
MPVYGGGTQISDSVYVGDVAKVFVSAIESAVNGVVPDHPIDCGNITPTSVLQVANIVAENIKGALINDLPMRAGEPHNGAVRTQEQLLEVVDAVCATNPDLRRIDVRRVVRELSTVVSADTTTLEKIGVDPKSFTPLSVAIPETIQWFRENEGITWHKPTK